MCGINIRWREQQIWVLWVINTYIAGTLATDGRNAEGAGSDVGTEYYITLGFVDDRKVHIVENRSNTNDS